MNVKMLAGQLSYHCYDNSKPLISPPAVAKCQANCLDGVETIGKGGFLWILPTASAESIRKPRLRKYVPGWS